MPRFSDPILTIALLSPQLSPSTFLSLFLGLGTPCALVPLSLVKPHSGTHQGSIDNNWSVNGVLGLVRKPCVTHWSWRQGTERKSTTCSYSALVAPAGPPGSALVSPEYYLLPSLLLFGLLQSLLVEFLCSQELFASNWEGRDKGRN